MNSTCGPETSCKAMAVVHPINLVWVPLNEELVIRFLETVFGTQSSIFRPQHHFSYRKLLCQHHIPSRVVHIQCLINFMVW
jgi:hypothetical protein